MSEQAAVQRLNDLGDHAYLVHLSQDGEAVIVRVVASPDLVVRLGGDDQAAVRATIDFLLEHQPAYDLPANLELEDVAAAYPDFADVVGARVRAG